MLTGRAASSIMSGFGYKSYYYAALSIIEKKEEK
jgi:3-dehydroquinate dehydratase